MKDKLNQEDHEILLRLIRGATMTEAAKAHSITSPAISNRLKVMRHITGSRTMFELIALEMVNLMTLGEVELNSLLREKSKSVSVGE